MTVSTRPGEIVNSSACLRQSAPLLVFVIVVMALFGCDESGDASSRVNGSAHIPAGRAADTVNGSIDIDATPIPFSGSSPPN